MLTRRINVLLVVAIASALFPSLAAHADDDVDVAPNNRRTDLRVTHRVTIPGQQRNAPAADANAAGNEPAAAPDCGAVDGQLDVGCGAGRVPGAVAATLVNPAEVAQEAAATLHIPTPTVAIRPLMRFQDGRQGGLTQLPMWLWQTPVSWRTYSVRAQAGPVWAAVTARPVAQIWTFGDGSTIACDGPGTPYANGADALAGSPDCGYRYTTTSREMPGGAYHIAVAVIWRLTWIGYDNTGGELPPVRSDTTVPYVVRQARAELVSP